MLEPGASRVRALAGSDLRRRAAVPRVRPAACVRSHTNTMTLVRRYQSMRLKTPLLCLLLTSTLASAACSDVCDDAGEKGQDCRVFGLSEEQIADRYGGGKDCSGTTACEAECLVSFDCDQINAYYGLDWSDEFARCMLDCKSPKLPFEAIDAYCEAKAAVTCDETTTYAECVDSTRGSADTRRQCVAELEAQYRCGSANSAWACIESSPGDPTQPAECECSLSVDTLQYQCVGACGAECAAARNCWLSQHGP